MRGSFLTHDNLARIWAICLIPLFGSPIFLLFSAVFDDGVGIGSVSFMFWINILVMIGIVLMAFVALIENRALKYVGYGFLFLMLEPVFLGGSSGGAVGTVRVPWSEQLMYLMLATGSFGFSLAEMRDATEKEVTEEVS